MRVLVIDDEPDIQEVVRLCFGLRWPEAEVVVAATGLAGIEAARAGHVDMVILDIGLPDIDGFEVCRDLRSHSETPIIMLTARDSEVDKVKGLEAGADDYITKPFSHIELLARVRAVLRRTEARDEGSATGVFDSPGLRIDYAKREVTARGEPVRLTRTEYDLLYHLTRNASRVLSFHTLLAKIWGKEYADESDYLKVHIQRLRQKLGDDPHSDQWIVNERGVGYMFVPARDAAAPPSPGGSSS